MEIAKTGIFKSLFSLFGITKRVDHLETDVNDIRKEVRYEITCDKIVEGLNVQFKDVKELQKETRDDVKKLLMRR